MNRPMKYWLPFTTALLLVAGPALGEPLKVGCGEYELRGKLRANSSGADVLDLFAGTQNRISVVITGLSPDDVFRYLDRFVSIRVRIGQADALIGVRARASAVIGGVIRREAFEKPAKLIATGKCDPATPPQAVNHRTDSTKSAPPPGSVTAPAKNGKAGDGR